MHGTTVGGLVAEQLSPTLGISRNRVAMSYEIQLSLIWQRVPRRNSEETMDSKNLDMYGSEQIPWTRALRQLEAGESKGSTWLATTRPDGRPHVAGIGAIWVDGTFYFVSGAGTRKSRNLAENPHCVLSVSLPDMDLVVEGSAT